MSRSASLRYFHVALAITLLLMAIVLVLPERYHPLIQDEGSLVEMTSAILFFFSAALLATKWRRAWPFSLLLLAFGLRELDLDKRPFTLGVLKSRQYLSDTIPASEKIAAALILVCLLVVAFTVIKRGTGPLLRGLRQGNGIAWTVALALFLIVTARLLDGPGRKLEKLGITITDDTAQWAALLEEPIELAMAFALLVASIAFLLATQHAPAPEARHIYQGDT